MVAARFLDIPPLERVAGRIRVPGSKSISNRSLLLAGFAEGTTTIEGLLDSDDTRVMIAALRTLGARIDVRDANETRVVGIAGRPLVSSASLFLGNAGTAMRPLAAALAITCTRHGGAYELRGTPRMHERPIGDLVQALRSIGCGVDYLGADGYPPLRVFGAGSPAEPTRTSAIRVRGDVSSQFLSALLMALPMRCAADAADHAVIEVEGALISRPYVDITLDVLARFGVAIVRDGDDFRVPALPPRAPGRFVVEGDASSATYPIAWGAIAADPTSPLRIEGIGVRSIQGDIAFADAVRAMGANVTFGEDHVAVSRGRMPLAPISIDANAMPDAAMTLAALALYADGPSRLSNIASWRVKETDRLAAMATELRRCGAKVAEGADFLEIAPPETWSAAAFDTYDDHRMAMAMSVAAFNAVAAPDGAVPIRIRDPGCVAKTWPDHFEALFSVASTSMASIPVLAIDGPTASGKGTLAAAVARALGYRLLDSGAVYRAAALAAIDAGIPAEDHAALAALSASIDLHFEGGRAQLAGRDVTEALRLEHVGAMASRISAWPSVRAALLGRQIAFRALPGLVADGRDMGSVVFPDAALKVFLTASAAERAARRFKQLISKGIPANIDGLRADLEARDARDKQRSVSPLKPAEGALMLDNSALSIESSVDVVLNAWQERRPF